MVKVPGSRVHSDFNVHPFLNLTRQINMGVHLNGDWDPSWGGQLELWDQDMSEAIVAVAPNLGQVVIFNTPDPRSTLWKEKPGEDFLSRPSARFKAVSGHLRRVFLTAAGK